MRNQRLEHTCQRIDWNGSLNPTGRTVLRSMVGITAKSFQGRDKQVLVQIFNRDENVAIGSI